MRATDIG